MRLLAASLSGVADAAWGRAVASHVDCALLGGLALDGPTREAARAMVARDREEFLPDDPVAWAEREFAALADAPVRPGLNVRAAAPASIRPVAEVCAAHDAVLEVNAHCRQAEMCAAGAGERLLCDPDALATQVAAAGPATTSVKLRAEVDGADLRAAARAASAAGADLLHVDAMDTPESVAQVAAAAPEATVVGNNGVRDAPTARRYLDRGADAVSVGRPTGEPELLARVTGDIETAWRVPELPGGSP
ncbi:MAG: tRNA-dihydrouridine synthase [Haloferacaceae archaeon]